jgi:hypothetical protein
MGEVQANLPNVIWRNRIENSTWEAYVQIEQLDYIKMLLRETDYVMDLSK